MEAWLSTRTTTRIVGRKRRDRSSISAGHVACSKHGNSTIGEGRLLTFIRSVGTRQASLSQHEHADTISRVRGLDSRPTTNRVHQGIISINTAGRSAQ
jgi:hypothetical protein